MYILGSVRMAVSRLILAAALGVTLLAGVWADGEGKSLPAHTAVFAPDT